MTLAEIRRAIRRAGDPRKARRAAGYFKTGPGQYAHGERFLGIDAAGQRDLARRFAGATAPQLESLLGSAIHDERSVALLILVNRYRREDAAGRGLVYSFYMAHLDGVNNWDLVDCSAAPIAGAHLMERSRAPLHRLARSRDLWRRRVAIVATHHFIRNGQFADTLQIVQRLLGDDEDLIHKACGWMLREVGKKDRAVLEGFLAKHLAEMPRTALRYAIERFPGPLRRRYLDGTIRG